MAKRRVKQAHGANALARRQTPAQRRMEDLNKEHERLLRAIADKQRRLADAKRLRSEVHTRAALEVEPLERRVAVLTREIRETFERLLATAGNGPQGFSRRFQTTVRERYVAFLESFTFDDFEDEQEGQVPPPAADGEVTFTAPKPDVERARTQHAVFRRLVNAVHPDKVQSEADVAARTALLKQVTAAYEANDLLRLLQFEKELLVSPPEENAAERLAERITELTSRNVELKQQLKSVSRALRGVLQTLPLDVERSTRGRRTTMDERLEFTVLWWRERAQRLEAILHALRDVEGGNARALALLQSSLRMDVPWNEAERVPRKAAYVQKAPSEVDAANVDAVLKSFKDVLGQRRKR